MEKTSISARTDVWMDDYKKKFKSNGKVNYSSVYCKKLFTIIFACCLQWNCRNEPISLQGWQHRIAGLTFALLPVPQQYRCFFLVINSHFTFTQILLNMKLNSVYNIYNKCNGIYFLKHYGIICNYYSTGNSPDCKPCKKNGNRYQNNPNAKGSNTYVIIKLFRRRNSFYIFSLNSFLSVIYSPHTNK